MDIHANVRASASDVTLRVEALRAAGLLAVHASTSVSFHALAFGVIKTPGGKACESIRRFSVMRLLTMPFATRSLYLISLMVASHGRAPDIGRAHEI
jgi:hypothetical protein